MNDKKNSTVFSGLAVALSYTLWGLLILYWNLLSSVNPVFILSQRVIWSMIVMAIYIAFKKGFGEIKEIFRSGKSFLLCLICGILVTINWGVYIYAVNSSHVLDASLGYFVEPVMVGLIGFICFKEKPSKLDRITYIFAAAGLIFILVANKTIPSISLIIGGSFAIYGAVKKNLSLSAEASLFMETLCVTPAALAFAIYAQFHGMGTSGVISGPSLLLLPACGIITSVPLLLFNIGVKNIRYYINGILMYINPTLQFLLGRFYFHEELDKNRLTAFIIIWIGITFTIIDKIKDAAKSDNGKEIKA